MKEFIEQWFGNTYPRGMGNPMRGNIISGFHIAREALDVVNFAEANNNTNVYTTVYSFTKYDDPATDGNNGIIDTIPFDFDSTNLQASKNDAMKLVSWCDRHEVTPRITFSGGKGFHVFIDINTIRLINSKRTLVQFSSELSAAAEFTTTVDGIIFGDTNRLIRIPNTRHSKSGLYCIPLTADELLTLSLDDILKLAKSPRYDDFIRVNNKNSDIISTLLDIDANMPPEADFKLVSNSTSKLSRIFEHRPITSCRATEMLVSYGIDEGARDLALTGIIRYYTLRGLSYDEIVKKCVSFDSKCARPLRRSTIHYKVKYHMKKDYSPCSFLRKIGGVCDGCNKYN